MQATHLHSTGTPNLGAVMIGLNLKAPRELRLKKKKSSSSKESFCLTNIRLKIYLISVDVYVWGFLKGKEANASKRKRALSSKSSF